MMLVACLQEKEAGLTLQPSAFLAELQISHKTFTGESEYQVCSRVPLRVRQFEITCCSCKVIYCSPAQSLLARRLNCV